MNLSVSGLKKITHSNVAIMETQNFTKELNTSEKLENVSDRESSIESFRTNQSDHSITTESELIDLDDIELSDEESWLYKSPKKSLPQEEKPACSKQNASNEGVSDSDNRQTRHALLSKLNQLKYKATILHKSSTEGPINPDRKTSLEEKKSNPDCLDCKNSQVVDVVDVQKLAKLQEESLKQRTYTLLNYSDSQTPSSTDLSPVSPSQVLHLNKPASVEGLNVSYEELNSSNMYSIVSSPGMTKQKPFNSSALNASSEYHHSSLPNINKGYYSLKSRKSKRPNEQKVPCPLPIYPTNSKTAHSGSSLQVSSNPNDLFSTYDPQQSNTLPSSYRMNRRRNSSNSRSNLASNSDQSVSLSIRRDSTPVSNTNSVNSKCNYRKLSSPVPLNIPQRYTMAVSPSKAFAHSQSLRSPQGTECQRAASHSPARRLPLAMVQHQCSKKENSLKNGEMGQIPVKVPSKLQSRSGIPVPSCQPRLNDEAWSQDCF